MFFKFLITIVVASSVGISPLWAEKNFAVQKADLESLQKDPRLAEASLLNEAKAYDSGIMIMIISSTRQVGCGIFKKGGSTALLYKENFSVETKQMNSNLKANGKVIFHPSDPYFQEIAHLESSLSAMFARTEIAPEPLIMDGGWCFLIRYLHEDDVKIVKMRIGVEGSEILELSGYLAKRFTCDADWAGMKQVFKEIDRNLKLYKID